MTPEMLAFIAAQVTRQLVPLIIDAFKLLSGHQATEADWDALKTTWAKTTDTYVEEAQRRAKIG